MLKRVAATIEKYNMLPQNSKVIVALSGGADSVCLLLCLNELKDKYGVQLFAVHVNHLLRVAADDDESFVRNLCAEFNIPFTSYRRDVGKEAKEKGISEELAGRNVRYESFNAELKKRNADIIATGHNKNDNAETVFLNMLRGAALRGLCGIPPVRENIIRPLIETERSEIISFLQDRGISFLTDETNAQDIYSRNKIRNNVLPYVEQNFNPSLTSGLFRLSSALRDDNDFLELEAKKCYALCRAYDGEASICLTVFNNFHTAIKSRIVRILFTEASGSSADLEYTHIEAVLSLCGKETGKAYSLPHGIVAERSYDKLYIHKKDLGITEFCYDLKAEQALFIEELGKTVKMSFKNDCNNSPDVCTKAFNYDIMKSGIKIRNRRSGDKIYLSGINGHKKLSDYFTDKKIPRHERDKIVLVACGSDVLWMLDKSCMTNGIYCSGEVTNKAIYISVY